MMTDLLERAHRKGTDKQYRAWVQRQPSCVSGQWSEWLADLGEGRCEAAHVRRAGESGTGFKAPYACVPLTREEHARQHQHGESSLACKQWFDEQAVKYLTLWINSP